MYFYYISITLDRYYNVEAFKVFVAVEQRLQAAIVANVYRFLLPASQCTFVRVFGWSKAANMTMTIRLHVRYIMHYTIAHTQTHTPTHRLSYTVTWINYYYYWLNYSLPYV